MKVTSEVIKAGELKHLISQYKRNQPRSR